MLHLSKAFLNRKFKTNTGTTHTCVGTGIGDVATSAFVVGAEVSSSGTSLKTFLLRDVTFEGDVTAIPATEVI